MQYPNGKLEFQLPERNTDRSYSLHPYYKSLVPNLMSILETEERTDMTHGFSKLTLGSPWVMLGSPCSQCQTHCACIVLDSNPCVVQCTKGVILPGEQLHHQIMILLGASLWPNPSKPQHPDADVKLLCAVCKFPHLHERSKEHQVIVHWLYLWLDKSLVTHMFWFIFLLRFWTCSFEKKIHFWSKYKIRDVGAPLEVTWV
jgi:hypothetical protein